MPLSYGPIRYDFTQNISLTDITYITSVTKAEYESEVELSYGVPIIKILNKNDSDVAIQHGIT